MKNTLRLTVLILSLLTAVAMPSIAQTENQNPIFDDKQMLEGYAKQYADEPKDVLLAMINDDTLSAYRTAAAIRVFNEKFSQTVFAKEKIYFEKALLRRLDRTTSVFVEIEIRYGLCKMDRYKYFESMMIPLLHRLDHYNKIVNEFSYAYIDAIIKSGQNRSREARIVFNTLRKMLFLSHKKIKENTPPDERLKQKIELLRWSIKILGNQELQRLPSEVINLF